MCSLTDRNAAWEDLYLTSQNGMEAAVPSFSYVHCHTFNSYMLKYAQMFVKVYDHAQIYRCMHTLQPSKRSWIICSILRQIIDIIGTSLEYCQHIQRAIKRIIIMSVLEYISLRLFFCCHRPLLWLLIVGMFPHYCCMWLLYPLLIVAGVPDILFFAVDH